MISHLKTVRTKLAKKAKGSSSGACASRPRAGIMNRRIWSRSFVGASLTHVAFLSPTETYMARTLKINDKTCPEGTR